MGLGLPEVLVILVIALLFFGPSQLPGLGKSLGEAIRGFKKGMNEDPEDNKSERIAQDDSKKTYNKEQEKSENKKNS